ncbi:restriction endonuclease subunit S [Fusobacterium polymorphum]|uniref:restriction endonuclease subunit S n=1 Tax=Fusobacterium nucleatum subsp. polymorphum TaxID=76857 RepID=UPI00300A628F
MAKNKKVEISLEEKLEKALVPVEEQPYIIPDNWVWTKYDVLFSDISKSEKKIEEKNYLENGKIAIVSQGKDKIVGYSDILKVEPYKEELPLIIFGDHTLNVKYIDFPFYIGADGVKVLKTTSIIILKFLFYLLNNLKTFTLINTGYRRHYPILKKLFFPLPPLNEQKRIVEKLDFLFEKTKRAKEIIEEIKIDIENRKISILDRAFKGVLTFKWRNENKTSDTKELLKSINEKKLKKWEEECLQAEKDGNKKAKKPIIKEVKDMIVPVEEQPYKLPDSWVWVRLGEVVEVNPNKIKIDIGENELVDFIPMKNVSESSPKIIEKNFEKFKDLQKGYTQFIKNDILFAKITPCMENGKTAIISDLKEKIGYGSTEFHILRSTKIINNKLLYNFLKQKGFREDARYNMTGSVGFRRVPTEFMKSYPFPLPPLEEQQEIVRILDEVLENENKVKELLELEERIDVLEKSILNKAFKGELGTQNSNDEPAIELLKEIL